jgi:hypothetical protein
MKALSVYLDDHENHNRWGFISALLVKANDNREINTELLETAIKEAIEKLGLSVGYWHQFGDYDDLKDTLRPGEDDDDEKD